MFKFSKQQLDTLGTILGLVAGICGVLVSNHIGDENIIGTVGGIATVCLGYVVQRPSDLKYR